MSIIEELDAIRTNIVSYEYGKLQSILNDLLPSIPISSVRIKNSPNALSNSNSGPSNLLFRARPHKPSTNQNPYSHIDEISCISEDKRHLIKTFGRVNKPSQSVFYCSDDWHVACLEGISKGENLQSLNKEGEYWLTLSTWKLKEDLHLAEILRSERFLHQFIQDAPNFKGLETDLSQARKYNEQTRQKISSDGLFEIMMFFTDEFARTDTKNPKQYMFSNYYADRILNKIVGFNCGADFDGLRYPSVPSLYTYQNFAFEPEVARSKLGFLWASRVHIRFIGPDIEIDFHDNNERARIDGDGNILW